MQWSSYSVINVVTRTKNGTKRLCALPMESTCNKKLVDECFTGLRLVIVASKQSHFNCNGFPLQGKHDLTSINNNTQLFL